MDLWREDIDVYVINRLLGHARLDVTARYLSGLGADDLMRVVAERPAPVLPIDIRLALTDLALGYKVLPPLGVPYGGMLRTQRQAPVAR